MNRFILFCLSILCIPTFAQLQGVKLLNQTTTLHTTTTILGVNTAEYLVQPKQDQVVQKLLLSPFLFGAKERAMLLSNFRLNLVQEGSLTTLGIANGVTWLSKNEKAEKVMSQLLAGVNVTLFPNWGAPSRDENRDGLSDNFYSLAETSFTLGFARVTVKENQYTLQAIYEQKREEAIENTRQVISVGYSASFMNPIKFNRKEGKLPLQLQWGGVVEQILPIHNQSALENGNQYELSIAPQFEIQFYSNTVLRTSLPFHVIEGKRDERGFGSFFQLFLAI